MTVTYTHEVADCRGFGNFWRLLFRWRGSVYKLVWPELLLYSGLYTVFSVVYRLALDEPGKRTFEKVSLYCQYFSDLIPVSFVLGFYVSIVVQRWWAQYQLLPWPDSLALIVTSSIHGHDDRGRLMRRTIMRYLNLSFTMTLCMITPRAKKRFPTYEHLVDSGLMTSGERKIIEDVESKAPHPIYYLPLVWAGSLVARARKEGRIRDDFAVKTIIDTINTLRGQCGGLLSYDWISIPLVYTQVVSLAVYSFFLATVMGRQFLDPKQGYPNHNLDFFFPMFTFLQFFFYMGWFKVAESLVNPFGEDDDDFEVNWLIDRNIQVSFLIVDEMHNEHPELVQDMYWDEVFPQELPYTFASEQYRREPPMGSTANLEIPVQEQDFLPVLDEEPEDREDAESKGTPTLSKRRGSLRSVGSSLHSGRKSSILNFFHQRILGLNSRVGSSSSIRRSRFLNRSASRVSGHSGFGNSKFNVNRNNTSVSFQSEGTGMSRESLYHDARNSPRVHHAQARTPDDEDAPILIRIKRRDKDGKEVAESTEEVGRLEARGEEEEAEEGRRARKHSRGAGALGEVRFRSQISTASGISGLSDAEGIGGLQPHASQASIRTSIFPDQEEAPKEEVLREVVEEEEEQSRLRKPSGSSGGGGVLRSGRHHSGRKGTVVRYSLVSDDDEGRR